MQTLALVAPSSPRAAPPRAWPRRPMATFRRWKWANRRESSSMWYLPPFHRQPLPCRQSLSLAWICASSATWHCQPTLRSVRSRARGGRRAARVGAVGPPIGVPPGFRGDHSSEGSGRGRLPNRTPPGVPGCRDPARGQSTGVLRRAERRPPALRGSGQRRREGRR